MDRKYDLYRIRHNMFGIPVKRTPFRDEYDENWIFFNSKIAVFISGKRSTDLIPLISSCTQTYLNFSACQAFYHKSIIYGYHIYYLT